MLSVLCEEIISTCLNFLVTSNEVSLNVRTEKVSHCLFFLKYINVKAVLGFNGSKFCM